MSAVVGQDWRPKTFRELFVQYQAILLESWSHTSRLAQCHTDPKKRVSIQDLHPFMKKKEAPKQKVEPVNFLDDVYKEVERLEAQTAQLKKPNDN